jgi:hypothetical protein
MKRGIDFTFDVEKEITFRLKVKGFTPSRPAPACSNHDSPAFSDCGDDADFEDVAPFIVVKAKAWNTVDGRMQYVEIEKAIPIPDEIWLAIQDDFFPDIDAAGEDEAADYEDRRADYMRDVMMDR